VAVAQDAQVTALNSILAAHVGLSTVRGALTEGGPNLFTDSGAGRDAAGSLYDTDPRLGTFRNLGGATPVLAPEPGSPAIDAAVDGPCLALDQRGFPRPAGLRCDLGAVETGSALFFLRGTLLNGEGGIAGYRVFAGTNTTFTTTNGGFQFGPLQSGFYNVFPDFDGAGFTPSLITIPLVADATNVVFRTTPVRLFLQQDSVAQADILQFGGVPHHSYRIEGSSRLESWEDLGSAIPDDTGQARFTNSTPQTSQFFYRTVAP
jgi:hypothetical protein